MVLEDAVSRTGADPGPRTSSIRWLQLVAACPEPFFEVDGSGIVREWNPSAEVVFGWLRREVVGRPMTETIVPDDARHPLVLALGDDPRIGAMVEAPCDRHRCTIVGRHRGLVTVDAVLLPAERERGVAGFLRPDSDRGLLREPSSDRSTPPPPAVDALTGMATLPEFVSRLADSAVRVGASPGSRAVVLVGVDRFKDVNNALGHDIGDLLLRALSERLASVGGDAVLLARFGGDEFLAFFEQQDGRGTLDQAKAFAERVHAALLDPFTVAGAEVFVRVSLGVALNTFGVDDSTELLANAEAAMYQAKHRSWSPLETFGEPMRLEVVDRLATEHSLHRALERDELELHYQPVVELDATEAVGVEALLRWQHPGRGLVEPHRFVPVAEDSGLIIPIGAWVLEQACRQLSTWRADRFGGVRSSVEVNVSARQIDDRRIVETVEEILVRTGLPPDLLTLEITESALMHDTSTALQVLRALKDLGVMLAIDDFGTGYASLTYLQSYPLDVVKIDKSFVESLGVSPQGEVIVAAVIDLSHALGLKVVAEGVETRIQLEALRSLGCDLAQGFLFCRPLPAHQIDTLELAVPA